MKSMNRIALACASLALMGACATPYTPIPYDKTAANIEKIQVVEDMFPDSVSTQKLATNGQNMSSALAAQAGLAGVLVGAAIAGVEAGIEAGQRERITKALATQDFDGEKIFADALKAALTEQGYELSDRAVKRKSNAEHLTLNPSKDADAATAVLDIAGAGYGFQLIGGNTDWRPYVNISVRLMDATDPTKILAENRVA